MQRAGRATIRASHVPLATLAQVFSPAPLTVLVTIPTSDRAFERFVSDTYSSDLAASDFEARIRARYPDAVVRTRVLSGELFTMWYVYRDGGWHPAGEPEVDG